MAVSRPTQSIKSKNPALVSKVVAILSSFSFVGVLTFLADFRFWNVASISIFLLLSFCNHHKADVSKLLPLLAFFHHPPPTIIFLLLLSIYCRLQFSYIIMNLPLSDSWNCHSPINIFFKPKLEHAPFLSVQPTQRKCINWKTSQKLKYKNNRNKRNLGVNLHHLPHFKCKQTVEGEIYVNTKKLVSIMFHK